MAMVSRSAISGLLFLVVAAWWCISYAEATAPCTGEVPDICGFLPSTYPDLGFGGFPPFCIGNCSLEGGYDECGICGGIAGPPPQTLFQPLGFPALSRIGGSVATWNGSFAVSQHIAQELPPLVSAPIATWTLNHNTLAYSYFVIPSSNDGSSSGVVPLGRGYGLCMSANYLAIGSHDSTPRVVELWVLNNGIWNWLWTANDPCPGTLFGFSMAIDERIPKGDHPGDYGTVMAGNPAAFGTGRVFVYFSYSSGIYQELAGNTSAAYCFGESVSADSGLLVVGSPAYTYAGQTKAGFVYVYFWNTTAPTFGEYQLLLTIPPPVPMVNGGFGVDVAVWEDIVVIGDNQANVYEYQIVGNTAVPILLPQPDNLNAASRNGYAVTVWDEFIASGDEDFIPAQPWKRGSTFIWDRNPIVTNFYRLFYYEDDPSSAVSTRYGADVDNRGGCYVVVGATNYAPYGGAWVVDLCRGDCYGCDGVLNSCAMDDFCGVCLGDNSTCVDCNGVYHGPTQNDACDVCGGTNTTCVVGTFPTHFNINCSTILRVNLTHLFQAQWGNAEWTLLNPLPVDGTPVLLTETVQPGSVLVTTLEYIPIVGHIGTDHVYLQATIPATGATGIFNITLNISACNDCFGVHGGNATYDLCGVCNGTNTTCKGCDGVPNSEKVYDVCGVCGGDGTECLNITVGTNLTETCTAEIIIQLTHFPATTPVIWSIIMPPAEGSVFLHSTTGVLQWNNPGISGPVVIGVQAVSQLNHSVVATENITFEIGVCVDCSGTQLGLQLVDICGVCGGNGLECLDCFGIPNGTAVLDQCDVCNGTNSTCTPGGTPVGVIITVTVVIMVAVCLLLYVFVTTWLPPTSGAYLPIPTNLNQIPQPPVLQTVQPEIARTPQPAMYPGGYQTTPVAKMNAAFPGQTEVVPLSAPIGGSVRPSVRKVHFDPHIRRHS